MKKPEITSDHGGTMEHVESGKQSPVNLGSYDSNIRTGGGSQPNSPTTGRRKFIKRHHSATNIATTDVHDDFHRSKSEGEDEEGVFSSRTSHATKAYSYARPPPPSYRESRSKGSFKVTSHTNNTPNTQVVSREPSVSTDNNESRDFNSLSEETKKRLLRVTLQKKVSEKKKQKTTDESAEAASSQTPNETFENSQKVVAHTSIVPCDVPETVMFSQSPTERETDDQMVVAEPQLKASEIRKRFESFSESNRTACPNVEDRTLTGDPSPQLRKRDGPITCSSSRNFKIYSDAEVNFGQYRSNQINEWLQDMGKNGRSGTDRRDREHSERGRARAKTEEVWKGRRSASVSRASFVKDDEETVIKRRSLSCQDINLGDDDMFSVGRTRSKSSGSSDTSDEEDDPLDASSKAFDEKLHCMLQRNKMENRSKTELQPTRRKPHNDRPSSNRGGRSSVEKMRAMDPSSKIQSGAVSSMKSLFESGVPHQHTTKSRSSSVSSNSSGSVMSFDTQRRRSSCSTNPASDAEMKRRVWETDSPTREGRKKWKEPVWVAKERAMKSLKSDSGSSLHKHSDEINNNVRNDKKSGPDVRVQYARSASLPAKQTANDSVLEPANIGRKTDVTIGKANVEKKIVCEKTIEPVHNQPTSDKRIHVVKKFTSTNRNIPESSIHYEVEKKIPSGSHSGHSTDFKTPSSHRVVRATTSSPVDPQNVFQEQKPSVHSRRRIVSDSSHRVPPVSRHPNVRTFTAPILGTIVTTTTAFELEGFAFKPESNTRNPRGRCLRKSENQKPGFSEPRLDWQTNETLDIPSSSSHKGYRSPEVRRQGRLPVPEQEEDLKRLSTDRSILEQNALHIKELLDEMNTEHSLKMERQKSDTISINAQKSARKRAMRRRLSLGQDRENGVVVASCVSSPINERSRKETKPPLATTSNELQRNISTVKWVGVSS